MAADFAPVTALTCPGEAAGNLEALARLFPGVVTEQGLDVDALREILGEKVRPGAEVFGLRWPGMGEARRLSAEPATGTLLPRPGESVDWDTTRNVVIEGDNLEVLRLLRRGYTGKVDVIYIDPPYNTGNDFVYDDSRMSTIAEYETEAGLRDALGPLQVGEGSDRAQDRRSAASRHTRWLSMMYPRLLVAHNLLKDTGVVIVAIDDTEHARLRLLLDKVFGAENFAANVVWQGVGKNDARFTAGGNDYMLIYAKDVGLLVRNDVRWVEPKEGYELVLAASKRAWAESGHDAGRATEIFRKWWNTKPDVEKGLLQYKEIDEHGKAFRRSPVSSPNPRENLMFDVPHPVTGRPVVAPPNGWRYSRESMAEKIAEGLILFGRDHESTISSKTYLEDAREQPIRPAFWQVRATASEALAKSLQAQVFDFPKDVSVLAKWINAVTQGDKKAFVLDFFAGSGSVGHAVMNLNAADDGERRYVLVQLDEKVGKNGYETIAGIARERLRRAGAEIAARRRVDTGFRSYRLATSNIKAWNGLAELDLLGSVDNLVEGRGTDDLLVEMMLRLGVDLVTPVEIREVGGSTLYNVGGTVYAYFGADVTTDRADKVAKAIVAWRDENPANSDITVVVRDTGFRDDCAKLNFAVALEQAGFTTLRSI